MKFDWLKRTKREITDLETRVVCTADLTEIQPSSKYLGILDTYGVSWTLEKVARDTLQNFFDSNNLTLDGVDISVSRAGRDYVVRIQNHATYDFRRLMHLGGTTKGDDNFSAGGIGEGAKILAFALLRDHSFSQVRFGSQDWTVDFSLDQVPEGEYVEKIKGLFAHLSHNPNPINGNFIEFRTTNRSNADAFIRAKDLFYHSDNPDFQNPTLNIPRVGGFKFLGGNTEYNKFPKGNFYHAGQRRHFDEEKWDDVEYVNVWTLANDVLRKDRDRGIVTRKELLQLVIPKIIDASSRDGLTKAVYEMKPIWTEGKGFNDLVGPSILEGIVNRLGDTGAKLKFEDKYLADDIPFDWFSKEALRAVGYTICVPAFNKVGMKPASDRFREMQEHCREESTGLERERMEILYEAARKLEKKPKEIWVFDRKKENSIVLGQYNGKYIWMSREKLRDIFSSALATYLHELDHEHGNDGDKKFGYALTDTIAVVVSSMIKNPSVYQALNQRWNST